jgi:hypothetical protein
LLSGSVIGAPAIGSSPLNGRSDLESVKKFDSLGENHPTFCLNTSPDIDFCSP